MGLVLVRRCLLVVVGALACTGCLILDPVDFPERESVPPRIFETDPPTTEVRVIDRSTIGAETVDSKAWVFDADREDVIDARAFVDFHQVALKAVVEVDGADGLERMVTAPLNPGLAFVGRGCHVLELHVIDNRSGWSDNLSDQVRDGFIRATAIWFVLVHDGEGIEDIAMASCPRPDDDDEDEVEAP